MHTLKRTPHTPLRLGLAVGSLLLALLLILNRNVTAQEGETGSDGTAVSAPPISSLHPTFPLLDTNGSNVLASGQPISTMETCRACHDTDFIATHSFHADVGLSEFTEVGAVENGRSWDSSPGIFGKWNPLTYRYLSPEGDDIVDLTTADWISVFGVRHVGGGPSVTSRDGYPLSALPAGASNMDTQATDPASGALIPWDWAESGVVEMNCFLCHTPEPNNEARIAALQDGQFQWANTATLLGTGIVDQVNGAWQWNENAFDEDGEITKSFVNIQNPTDQNCAQCHGLVHVDAQTPLVLNECSPTQWSTITSGQIFSPQRLSSSGVNLENKASLTRSWDIHAERVVGCTDCHYALNNPIYYQESDSSQPGHLTFDPRRIDLGEYLYRPLHQFAKGQSAQNTLAAQFDNSLRTCESCHSIENTHNWLPYKERHTAVLSCETCHTPHMYSPARQTTDWTVLRPDGVPQGICRGVEGDGTTFSNVLITGFQPVLLPRLNADGTTSLAPHNLVSSWYWIHGEPARPVPYAALQAAWLDGEAQYAAEVLAAFDGNGDGALDTGELIINNDEKEALINGRLQAQGLENPRIVGEVQPYNINHNVTHGEWATKNCADCHSSESRITTPMLLANQIPGGVLPTFFGSSATAVTGELVTNDAGQLYYQPLTSSSDPNVASMYILGHDSVFWIDWLGVLIFLGTLFGVVIHGGLRFLAARRQTERHEPELREVYMYTVYERLWHWLQTLVIFILLFTGLIIHKPAQFGMFSFNYVVQIHNIMAFILIANAALAAFYHLASGEIRQFLPQPRGFFNDAIVQGKYYLHGIFRGEEHPYEKTRQRKMNPLQQATYFGLLNVLLPLQVITGILMWGAQRWPQISSQLGGLTFLAPFHTLISWLLASFIVAHVYLTTTGHTPTANIKAMIVGWDEVEVHGDSAQAAQSAD
ncbi:MAG: cytochrome b/b6 domain-containing protein [Chloroflexi bacterium]|nr:cytochrome b/b6 domain-containing protein [Chloroflexota bacterium]